LFSGGWIRGLPLLYVYLFAVWLVLIVLVGLAHWASARGRGH
jgi:hypothetical protein